MADGVDPNWVWNALNSVGTLGALIVGAISIHRSPKVVWIVEVNEICRVEGGQCWRIEIVNRGRGTATDVRTRTVRQRATTDEAEHPNIGQSDRIVLETAVDIEFIANINSPFRPRGDLEFHLTWRQAPDRIRPRSRTFSVSDRTAIRYRSR